MKFNIDKDNNNLTIMIYNDYKFKKNNVILFLINLKINQDNMYIII